MVFDSIHGRLTLREPTRVVVDTGGLGYEVHVPLGTYEQLPSVGEETALLLHLVVRDDDWKLFGFGQKEEREIFRALLRVSGVGPMIALAMLSGLRPDELSQAVTQGDVRTLTRVKGVGKKTAERIVLELRDVLEAAPGASETAPGEGAAPDVVAALLALGFDAGDAARRAAKAALKLPDASVGDQVRAAIRG